MTVQSSPSSSQGSGTSKILKDFVLGGTSGAIAKTLAAPIERVKLLLQTQENNPKLKERPYTGTFRFIQASSTASKDVSENKVSSPSGEETGPMSSDISQLKPLTSLPRTHWTLSSLKEWIQLNKKDNISSDHCFQEVSLVVLVWSSFILLISQEPDSEPISESLKEKDNSTVSLIVAERLSPRMEFKDYIKVSEFLLLVFLLTELSISGNFFIDFQRLWCW